MHLALLPVCLKRHPHFPPRDPTPPHPQGDWAAVKAKVLEDALSKLSLRAAKQDASGRLRAAAARRAAGAHLGDVEEMAREKAEDLPWDGLSDGVGAFTEFLPACPVLLARAARADAGGRPLPTEFFELLFDAWDTAALELGLRITRRRRGELMAMPFPEEELGGACARLAEMAVRMRQGLQAVVEKVQVLRLDAHEAQSRQQMVRACFPSCAAAGGRAVEPASVPLLARRSLFGPHVLHRCTRGANHAPARSSSACRCKRQTCGSAKSKALSRCALLPGNALPSRHSALRLSPPLISPPTSFPPPRRAPPPPAPAQGVSPVTSQPSSGLPAPRRISRTRL